MSALVLAGLWRPAPLHSILLIPPKCCDACLCADSPSPAFVLTAGMSSGTHDPYVKPARAGAGMGLFTRGKPRPIEYKRDTSRKNGGFLTAEENDVLWKSQSEVTADALSMRALPCDVFGTLVDAQYLMLCWL